MNILKLVGLALVLVLSIVAVACGETVTRDSDTVIAPTEKNLPWEPETEQVNFSSVPGCRVVGGSPPNIQVIKSVLRLQGETDISGGEPHVFAQTIRGIDQRVIAHIETYFPDDTSPEVEIIHGPPPSDQQHSNGALVVNPPSSALSEVYCAVRVTS